MLNLVSMRTLALGLASAVFVMSPVAHAATTASYQWTDLSLSITDADGNTTVNNGFVATGDSLWQNSLFLAHTTPEIANYDIFDATPLPTLQNTTLVRDLGVANAKVDLGVSASGLPSFSVALNSLPGVPLSSAGQSNPFSLVGGFAPLFFQQYLQAADASLDETPVGGGIWLDAGSTVTLSGIATATVSLDTADFEKLADGAHHAISAFGSIVMGLSPDGAPILNYGPADEGLAEGPEVTLSTARLPAGGLFQDTRTSVVSASLTNTSGSGQWLIVATSGVVDLTRVSSPIITPPTGGGNLIPEPGTYALMGLGLVGVALAARRQHARSC